MSNVIKYHKIGRIKKKHDALLLNQPVPREREGKVRAAYGGFKKYETEKQTIVTGQ